MSKINICFMTQNGVQTLKKNSKKITDLLKNNTGKEIVLKRIFGDDYQEKYFETKKYQIEDFTLKLSENGKYSEVDYENSITIYEHLKDLPRYIITDERFWAWFNFSIGYRAALQAIKIDKESAFLHHWVFSDGKRRGLFFGVMSRCFFRVERSVDERLDDKYELTKFVIENPERFRNLTWRANSNEKHIVLGVLKAEKEICEKYGDRVKNSIYKQLAKYISLYSSVRLIDVVTEQDIHDVIYKKFEEMVLSSEKSEE